MILIWKHGGQPIQLTIPQNPWLICGMGRWPGLVDRITPKCPCSLYWTLFLGYLMKCLGRGLKQQWRNTQVIIELFHHCLDAVMDYRWLTGGSSIQTRERYWWPVDTLIWIGSTYCSWWSGIPCRGSGLQFGCASGCPGECCSQECFCSAFGYCTHYSYTLSWRRQIWP